MYNLLPDSNPIKKVSKEFGRWWVEIPVYKQPDVRIDNVNIDSVVIKKLWNICLIQTSKQLKR